MITNEAAVQFQSYRYAPLKCLCCCVSVLLLALLLPLPINETADPETVALL
jgi:hypothetical protein